MTKLCSILFCVLIIFSLSSFSLSVKKISIKNNYNSYIELEMEVKIRGSNAKNNHLKEQGTINEKGAACCVPEPAYLSNPSLNHPSKNNDNSQPENK